jgi:hypothetical protein
VYGLKLVEKAAQMQNLQHRIKTQVFDLLQSPPPFPPLSTTTANETENMSSVPKADLYVLSDVSESTNVARGAARWTQQVLLRHNNNGARVWVFCQSDRAQRDAFVKELQNLLPQEYTSCLKWVNPDEVDPPLTPGTLWLCNVDETKVSYG